MTSIKPRIESVSVEAQLVRPLCNGERFPLISQKAICSCIISLHQFRCPDAILGRISQTIIFAFKRISSLWRITHVSQKVHKGPTPSVTDRNSASAVARKVLRSFWVIASLPHVGPSIISPISLIAGSPMYGVSATAISSVFFARLLVSHAHLRCVLVRAGRERQLFTGSSFII